MNGSNILKAKRLQNYHKVRASERDRVCDVCVRLVKTAIYTLNGEYRFDDWRCVTLGVENSRRYAVNPEAYTCDEFTPGRKDPQTCFQCGRLTPHDTITMQQFEEFDGEDYQIFERWICEECFAERHSDIFGEDKNAQP
jgi:hypothetical protein